MPEWRTARLKNGTQGHRVRSGEFRLALVGGCRAPGTEHGARAVFEETAAEVFPTLVTSNHKFENPKELSRIKNRKSIPRLVTLKLLERAKTERESLQKQKVKKQKQKAVTSKEHRFRDEVSSGTVEARGG